MRPSNIQKHLKTRSVFMFLHIPTFLSSDILLFDSQSKNSPFRLLKSINFNPQSLKTRYCFFHYFVCRFFFKKSLRAILSGVRILLRNCGPETNKFTKNSFAQIPSSTGWRFPKKLSKYYQKPPQQILVLVFKTLAIPEILNTA